MAKVRNFDETQIDGVKIADRSPARAIPLYAKRPGYPNSGPKQITGVSEILLEDGRVLNQCNDCFWPAETVQSVVSHRGRAHIRKHKVPTQRQAAKTRNHRVSYATPNAAPTPSNVNRVIEAVNAKKRKMTNAEIAEAAGLSVKDASDALNRAAVTQRVQRVERGVYISNDWIPDAASQKTARNDILQASIILGNLSRVLEKAAEQIAEMPNNWAEIAAKAKKYDELQEFLERK